MPWEHLPSTLHGHDDQHATDLGNDLRRDTLLTGNCTGRYAYFCFALAAAPRPCSRMESFSQEKKSGQEKAASNFYGVFPHGEILTNFDVKK